MQHNCYIDLDQLQGVVDILNLTLQQFLIFAGRIADTGIDPLPIMKEAVKIAKVKPNPKYFKASTRELFNIFQAEELNAK